MLRGRFGDTTGRPYVEGRLIFPRLNIHGDISFLVDTGADRSLLHPSDALRMNVAYSQLQGANVSTGIGGLMQHYVEKALVIFTVPGVYLYVYMLDMLICPPADQIMDLPSLLGRDILDKWKMIYHPMKKQLHFGVISADVKIPIPT